MDRTDLTNEAVKIISSKLAGKYLEDEISGFVTLGSSGRESIPLDAETFESRTDGNLVRNKRYPERVISVDWLITGSDANDLITKYNKLNGLLTKDVAKVFFNDEPDKYFNGFFINGNTRKGRHHVAGTYQIYCEDPFKYSTVEYSASPTANVWTISYDGTYKSFPKFTFAFPATYDANGNNTNTSECGYVGLANQAGAMLQFGDPEATDWADVQHPATIPLTRKFTTLTDWSQNSGRMISASYEQAGTAAVNSSSEVYASSYGSGSNFHGPSITYTLTDTTSATNFEFKVDHKFLGTKNQFGCFQCLMYNKTGSVRTLVAGFNCRKTTKDTKTKVYAYGGSNTANQTVYCKDIETSVITKQGNNVFVQVGHIEATKAGREFVATKIKVPLEYSVASKVVNEITFYFGQNGTQTAMGTNSVSWCQLMRSEYENFEDIPNIFMPGNTLTVDCKDASVYLDSGEAVDNMQSIGALGNDWETFVLTPGTNVIQAEYSDWTTTPPTATLKYRKVYL